MKGLYGGLPGSVVLGAFVLQILSAENVRAEEATVYSFCSQTVLCYDGANPSSLIEVNRTFYGITMTGGGEGAGTVYSFDPSTRAEAVLHDFAIGTRDGNYPTAGLVDVNGILYGTTYTGGRNDGGTVFSLDPSTGAEAVVYAFCGRNCADAYYPDATLIQVNGILYGTSVEGGASGDGTVFSLDPATGAEAVPYSFCSRKNCNDGAQPYSSLIASNGLLFGTTEHGGKDNDGTVFSLDPAAGAETVLHAFSGGSSDGALPLAGLIDVKGVLYGTTSAGGTYGQGTIFSIDPGSGSEKMLYAFGSHGGDGATPEAGLIEVRGALYGTTKNGGSGGYGTVVSFDPKTGAESVLYSFCSSTGCEDGMNPEAGLLKFTGRIYGTTVAGGAHQQGVIFRFPLPR